VRQLYIFAVITELFGIMLTTAGLVYEQITGADLGYVMITGGGVFVAVGSLFFAKLAPWLNEIRKSSR